MPKQDKIKELYFDCQYKQIEIAKELNVSTKYISKVLISDSRYKDEKERRKLNSKNIHRQKTIDYIKSKRKSKNTDIDYQILKQMHIQASQELSNGRNTISNRAYRDWNKSAYEYNPKNKCYILKKNINAGADVPKIIKWKNF